jgi:hypothetical protein
LSLVASIVLTVAFNTPASGSPASLRPNSGGFF